MNPILLLYILLTQMYMYMYLLSLNIIHTHKLLSQLIQIILIICRILHHPYFHPLSQHSMMTNQQLDAILNNQEKIISLLEQMNRSTHVPSETHLHVPPTTDLPPPTTCTSTKPHASIADTGPLEAVEDVLTRHKGDIEQHKYGVVAVALARRALFGRGLMAQCTFGGKGHLKLIPADGVQVIKRTISSLCQQREFDQVWSKYRNALNHACNSLREK